MHAFFAENRTARVLMKTLKMDIQAQFDTRL